MNDASTIAIAPRLRSRVPYLAEYAGYWAIEAKAAQVLIQKCQTLDISQHLDAVSASDAEPARVSVRRGYSYEVVDGVAVVSLEGLLMKHEASMDESTSTVMMRNTIRKMRIDDAVKAVVICVDSPGGTVSGAYDLADDIAALATGKPCYGYAQNLSASAGYLQLSQCREISAGRTALVGSIGTYASVRDYSGWFKKQGMRVHLIGSGGFKGAGLPGTKITAAQLAEWQREVDGLNAAFIDAVSKGRRLDRATVEKLADGRVHIAADAKNAKLIDRVESLDELVSRVSKSVNGSTPRTGEIRIQAVGAHVEMQPDETAQRAISDAADAAQEAAEDAAEQSEIKSEASPHSPESTSTPAQPEASEAGNSTGEPSQAQPQAAMGDPMSEQNAGGQAGNQGSPNTTSQGATIEQIEAACPGAPASFVLDQVKNKASVSAAQTAYIKFQQEQMAENSKRIETIRKSAKPFTFGAKPVRQAAAESDEDDSGSNQSGNAVEAFNDAVMKEMSKPTIKGDRKKAIANVMRKNPQLHREYLEAVNTSRKSRDLIADKFDGAE